MSKDKVFKVASANTLKNGGFVKVWLIIGPTIKSMSFETEGQALDMADAMQDAYEKGRESLKSELLDIIER